MEKTCETMLEDIDGYIVTQVKKFVRWHQVARYEEMDGLEVDELTQRVRIKFWRMLEKGQIFHPHSYARRIVHSEFIDMIRQRKLIVSLPDDEEEGTYAVKSQADPADEIIQRMEAYSLLRDLVRMVRELPPRQQMAMICLLWDQVDDLEQLQALFAIYGLDRKMTKWPLEQTERRAVLASLSVARQKMAKSRLRDWQHAG